MFKQTNTRLILILSFTLCFFASGMSTTDPPIRKLGIELGAGLYIGGEINRDNFIFDNGYAFSLSPLYRITDKWRAGGTVNYLNTENYRLLSGGLLTRFYTRTDGDSFFLEFSGGYADAWNHNHAAVNYTMEGGWFMSPGIGYQVLLAPNVRGNLSFLLMHQRMQYIFDHAIIGVVRSSAALDFLVIRCGIMF